MVRRAAVADPRGGLARAVAPPRLPVAAPPRRVGGAYPRGGVPTPGWACLPRGGGTDDAHQACRRPRGRLQPARRVGCTPGRRPPRGVRHLRTRATLGPPLPSMAHGVEKMINRKVKGKDIHDCHGHPCGPSGRFFLLPGGRGAAQRACNRRNRTFCPLAELSRGEGNFLGIFEPDDPSEAAALAAVRVGRPKWGLGLWAWPLGPGWIKYTYGWIKGSPNSAIFAPWRPSG